MKIKRSKYISNSIAFFLQSFKMNPLRFGLILLIDMVFYALIILFFLLAINYVKGEASFLDELDPQGILSSMDSSLIDSASSAIDSFIVHLKIAGSMLAALFIILFSSSSYLLWSEISSRKKTYVGFVKSMLVSTILLAIFAFMIFAAMKSADGIGLGFLFLLVLFIFASALVHALFAKTQSFIQALKDSLMLIRRMHRLSLPFLVLILMAIFSIMAFRMMNFFESGAMLMIYFVAWIVVYSAWARNYIYLLVTDLTRSKKE